MLDTIRIEPLKKSTEVVSLQRNSARSRDNIYTVSYILIWNRHMKIQFIYNQIYYCLEEMAFSHFILIRSCQGKKIYKKFADNFFHILQEATKWRETASQGLPDCRDVANIQELIKS